ncbi:hypothetical protein BKA61DRAFT_731911 [Leptodontidium sp. MPI-SDFR-AT-0119]|nr:hypothetical protein BKA61DRAFT_731911 [Leptodontidium sp. MPI-SDFR-AT-0119]
MAILTKLIVLAASVSQVYACVHAWAYIDTGDLPVNDGHYAQLDDNGSTKCQGFDINSLDQDGHYHANCVPGYVWAFTTNLRHAWYGYGSASFQWDTNFESGETDCGGCRESKSGTHCEKCNAIQFEDYLSPANMLQILCTGNPLSIGLQHGKTASLEISRSISFYASLFQRLSKLDWPAVTQLALKYQPYLSENWPQYVSEMQGAAEGAGVKQLPNLICLKIQKEDGLNIQMITEAGIIGKIGLNSQGVGCTLNALKAKGVSFSSLPCHLALRTVMESVTGFNLGGEGKPSQNPRLAKVLLDEKMGCGASMCRSETEVKGSLATLFSIVMDLEGKTATVAMGRPVNPVEKVVLNP